MSATRAGPRPTMPRSRRAIPAHNLKTTRSGDVRRRNLFWRWRRLFFLGALMVIVAVTGAGFVLSQVELPVDPPPEAQTTFICTAEVQYPTPCNEDNAAAVLHGEEDRVNVNLEEVPDVLIDAVVATEDRDFFEHGGVDPTGIARAALSDIRGNSASRQGGSTITQQYVKNVYLSDERTLTRKVREAVMSVKLEQEISKEQILENYLNTIYFGRGAYGVQAAAQVYFDKDVGEVDLAQAALMAGLIRAPERAEPYKHAEEARRRRRTVLDAMLQEEMISKAQRDAADALGFTIIDGGVYPWEPENSIAIAPALSLVQGDYFIDYVRGILAERYGDDALFGGGLRVYTTLDRNMQNMALQAVIQTLDQPEDPDASIVAIDDSGQVRAMVGGRDWANQKVNLAVGQESGGTGRQPGSTFKAFALAEALREGYSVESVVATPSAKVYPNAELGGEWRVSGGCCGGFTSLAEATAKSSNTAYAELMLKLGPTQVIDMAHDLGVTAPLDPPYPSTVLGAGEVSVLDMAAGYSTFANEGVQITPRVITRVERADGTLLEDFPADRKQVLTADQASHVTYALQQVVDHGTGEEADPGFPVAGKTGTTQNNVDAWFAGYTPTLTAAVWMGYSEGAIPMTEVHGEVVAGGNFPSRIWRRFMELAHEGMEPVDFPEPAPLEDGLQLYPELEGRWTPGGTGADPGTGATGGPGTDGTGGVTTEPDDTTTATSPTDTAPVTEPPVTDPPVTDPPVTDPPTDPTAPG